MNGGDDKGPPSDDDRTVVNPGTKAVAKPRTRPRASRATAKPQSEVAVETAGQVRPGEILNHIFEVRRFIARGGMGEVFEGINVNTDERVAIKVMLPHLAADPSIQAMFRKEARTLTKINHSGLVQYRVLAQEPRLGVFYIVTEFIEGASLSDRLATLQATPQQLRGLLRKLAEGLAAAHALGAIHRDISPDNVMLADDRLDRAKIIDFGIAKDLDPGEGTIIGDGFAGKLGYIAPEQLGDFDRSIGPWTDVYSLALTIMAVALGRDVNMGKTMVEAIDRRRSGVDLSAAPEEIRDVLEAMLRADPAKRLRSMEDVLRMLDRPPPPARKRLFTVAPGSNAAPAADEPDGTPERARRRPIVWAAAATLLVAGVVGAAVLLRGDGDAGGSAASRQIAATSLDRADVARRAVSSELRTLACSWLDVADVKASGDRVSVSFRGVSGKIPQALERIRGALRSVGVEQAAIDFSDVSPISSNTCGPIEAFVLVRADGPARLAVAQRKFEMTPLPADAGPQAGTPGAEAVFTLDLGRLPDDLSLVGIDEAGDMVQMAATKAEVIANAKDIGNGRYRFSFLTTHSGWSGILLLTGAGPFDRALLTSQPDMRDRDWEERFLKLARERNWKSEMVWYRTVDERS